MRVDALQAAIDMDLRDDFGVPYFNLGIELSAPCRGVAIRALIREIGVAGRHA